jgi:blue copper oxidase
VKSGTKLRIYFHNNLAEDSVIHPHGLRVPEDCDGTPMQAIGPGETKIYEFQVIDPAGPHWFHPHPHMRTAEQVAMGMAGLFRVGSGRGGWRCPAPAPGANDLPVIIQDRTFDSNNQILYQPEQHVGLPGEPHPGQWASQTRILAGAARYRLRILNGSNARTYKLAWSNGMPMQVIGTDGGLLPAVASRSYVMLMPGERVDVWADFSSLARKQVILRSLSFDPDGGMMGWRRWRRDGRHGRRRWRRWGRRWHGVGPLPMGAAFDILTVNVDGRQSRNRCWAPAALSVRYNASNVPNFNAPRPVHPGYAPDGLDDQRARLRDDGVAEDEMVHLGMIPMAWEWINNSPIPHPMHMHNVQFQVVSARLPLSAATPPSTRALSTAAGRIPSWSGRANGSRSP